MRRVSIFCFLLSAFCFSAVSQEFMQNRRKAFQVTSSAAATGPPAIFQVKTNVGTGVASISTTIDVGTDVNRVLLCYVSWYPPAITVYSNTFNGAYLSQLTNCSWYFGNAELWAKIAPDSGSHTFISYFSGNVDEYTVTLLALTNAAQSSTFNVPTNAPTDINEVVTLYPTTAANEVQYAFSTIGDSPKSFTVGTLQTIITNVPFGSGAHNSGSSYKAGSTVPTGYHTNTFVWSVDQYSGGCAVSVRGL